MKEDMKHGIFCDAENCVFHKGESTCTAKSISVGIKDACCCDDTRCSSFKIREDITHNYVTPT